MDLSASDKKWLPYVLLLIAAVPLFFMNVHQLHTWGGDDYALYIKEAENIARGIPFYKTNYVFYTRNLTYSPPQYPPGFPLMLAPLIMIWGLSIKPMLLLITAMVVGFMAALFGWLRKTGAQTIAAFCIALLAGYSWMLVDTKDQVLSDIPCMLFTMLYLLVRTADNLSARRIALLIVLAVMAMLIRTQSVLILAAEALYVAYGAGLRLSKREMPARQQWLQPVIIIGGTLAINLLLTKTIFYVPSTAGSFYSNYLRSALSEGLVTRFRNNVNFVTEVLNGCFYYPTDHGFRTMLVTVMQSFGLALTLLGVVLTMARRAGVKDFFFILVMIMMLYYPIHDKRYFLPALPLVFYYCYYGLKTVLPAVTSISSRHIALGITAIALFTGLKYFKETTLAPAGYVPTANDQKAFDYLQQHVADNDLILFSRPRFLTLYTNKRCMVQAWLLPMEQNKQIFDSMQVKYALTVRGLADDFNNHYLREVQQPIDSVIIADGYTLYRLR